MAVLQCVCCSVLQCVSLCITVSHKATQNNTQSSHCVPLQHTATNTVCCYCVSLCITVCHGRLCACAFQCVQVRGSVWQCCNVSYCVSLCATMCHLSFEAVCVCVHFSVCKCVVASGSVALCVTVCQCVPQCAHLLQCVAEHNCFKTQHAHVVGVCVFAGCEGEGGEGDMSI